MLPRALITRRSFVFGCIAANLPAIAAARRQASTLEATPASFTWPAPVDLGNDLELRDWRLSLGNGTSRFLAEIHNTSDTATAAPAVGVVLPHANGSGAFGWAVPFMPVIHGGQSTFVIGTTPENAAAERDWREPEWVLCGPAEDGADLLEKLEDLEYEVESSNTVHDPEWLACTMSVTNLAATPLSNMRLGGIVRDADGRICGGTAYSNLIRIEPDETLEMSVHVRPSVDFTASPFAFISDLTGATATFSVQPRGTAVNPGCPAVMPWNR